MEKMTYVKALEIAIATVENEEVKTKLTALQASIAKKNSAERKPTATQTANAGFKVAIENGRNAIGIELNQEFYKAAKEIFDKWDDSVYESNDSYENMISRFKEQLAIGEINKDKAKAEKEEKKEMTDKKKELQSKIKELEAELNALGLKKSEIKKIRTEAKEGVSE